MTNKYYMSHRDERLAYQKSRYAMNAEALREYQRQYRKKNVESEKVKDKARRTRNSERNRTRERERYAKRTKSENDRLLAMRKEWRDKNKQKIRERWLRRRARKLNAGREMIDLNEILKQSRGLCGICGHPLDLFGIEFDHIIPLARGGSHTRENLQAAHSRCNRAKGAKVG